MNDKSIIIKEFLESISGAIGMIGAGGTGLNDFVEEVNDTLSEYGLKIIPKHHPVIAPGIEVVIIDKGYPHE